MKRKAKKNLTLLIINSILYITVILSYILPYVESYLANRKPYYELIASILFGLISQSIYCLYQIGITIYFTVKYYKHRNYKIALFIYWLIIASFILVISLNKLDKIGQLIIIVMILCPSAILIAAPYNLILNYKLYKYES